MENINKVPPENGLPPKPSSRFSKKKIILITLLVVIFLGGSSGLAYQYYYVIKPAKILMAAFEKTFPLDSFQSELISNQENDHYELEINLHSMPEELSEVQFSLDRISGDPEEKVSLGIRFDSDDLYLVAVYTPDYKVYEPINMYYPEFLPTKTYQLIFPVMMGTHWLHTNIPYAKALIEEIFNLPTMGGEPDTQTSELQNQTDPALLGQAIIIRGFNRRFVIDGRRFYKIVVGFKKDKLLDYLTTLKQVDLTVDDFFVKSIIQAVESVESWDYDAAELLIDYQTGQLHEISFDLSVVPSETIIRLLRDANKRYFFIEDLSEVFPKMFEEPLGTVKFTNINQAPEVRMPDEDKMIEMETIYRSAEQEKLLPLLNILVKKVGF